MEIELRNVEASSPLIRAFTPNDPSLQEQVVDTQFGSVLVAHQGADHRAAASRPVILTYPDLGLNHITNFQAFFGSPDMKLLLRSFSVLHVNPPGQEEGAATLPDHFQYPTMDQMADQLENVCQHFEVKSVIGFGVGLGANVLSRFALQRPHRVDGLFLINATAGRSSWTEWLYQVSVSFPFPAHHSFRISTAEMEHVLLGRCPSEPDWHLPSVHTGLPDVAPLRRASQ